MKIKTRIILLQLVIVGIVLLMATIAHITIRSTDFYLQRIQWANHQLVAVMSVTVHANRFSEQIAELMLFGETEREDYLNASRELEKGFDTLEELTRGEATFLAHSGEPNDSPDELYRVQRMRTLHADIVRTVAQLVALRDQDRIDDAVKLLQREVENRLDAEFEQHLRAAMHDEQEEVDHAEREARLLWWRLAWISVFAALLALAICLIAATRLARALILPIRLLTQGTEAISHGELDHKIAYSEDDELGVLAQRFNAMAEQLEIQSVSVRGAQSNLTQQVSERTRDLDAANQRLTALDQLRVQFLADISHELRTPLTALRGEAEVTLRHGPKPVAAYRDALEQIAVLARDMGRLVDDLLAMARSETDTLQLAPSRLLLRDVVSDVMRDARTLGRRNRVTIQEQYASEAVWVIADAQRLKQVLMIVLDNAIKFAPLGRTVDVRMAAEGAFAEITVRNEGHGICATELPHVFERYYRGRGNVQSGHGLGLAIAKRLIEKQGGQIALVSVPDSFTEARIRIPIANEETHVEDSAGGR